MTTKMAQQAYTRVSGAEFLSPAEFPYLVGSPRTSGMHQEPLKPDDAEKTGSSTPNSASYDPYRDFTEHTPNQNQNRSEDALTPPPPLFARGVSTVSHPPSSLGVGTESGSAKDMSVEDEGLLPHLRGSGVSSPLAEKAGEIGPVSADAAAGEKAGGRKLSRRRRLGGIAFGDDDAQPATTAAAATTANAKRRRRRWCIGLAVLLVIAIAVAVPVGVVFGRKNSSSASGSGGSGSTSKGRTTGGDGSTVTAEDGSTFTYHNPFGGFWVENPQDPFDNSAQPNSWTPPLNQTWKFGVDKIYGVNIGGLFVLEPFITPALFEKYQNGSNTVVDEWTLSEAMAADTSPGGGLSQIENHYNTFITEQDIAQMAGAGLNWIRLPIPYWAIDAWDTPSVQEPFLAKVSWKYILRIFRWARKYGMRINLDLHTCPGSQNGFNHSGKLGQINFMNGIMGFANAQRMLEYIRTITEFISEPGYQELIPMFGIINEALVGIIGQDTLTHFYLNAYDMIRDITGIGEGKGAFISIHDGFQSLSIWENFLPGSDRINLDTHPYFAFGGVAIDPSVAPKQACQSWGSSMNQSMLDFGMTIAGEFSNGINDCGLFLQGVGSTSNEGANCTFWNDITQWDSTTKQEIMEFALASMDALQNWFFWTWKVGNSSATGTVQAPLWSYQLGLENGFIPPDPRSAIGKCASLSVTGTQFPGTFSAWQTGGAGAGTISPAVRSSFTAWPPSSITGASVPASDMPSYTSTAAMETLTPDTFTAASKGFSTGDGWADASDTASGVTEVAGCSYPDAWMAVGLTVPTSACTGGQTFAAREAIITPPPQI